MSSWNVWGSVFPGWELATQRYKGYRMSEQEEMWNVVAPQVQPKMGKVEVLPLVLMDLAIKSRAGEKKYGTPLMTENGRDALVDAYQEALDLCMYLRQAIEERS